MFKKIIASLLCIFILAGLSVCGFCEGDLETLDEMQDYLKKVDAKATEIQMPQLNLNVKSAVLMEASTGTILYQNEPDAALPPASVTKIMTLLLVMEALESGTIALSDEVTTSEHASSIGGTQIYLEVGETMTVNDLIKAVAVPSANDAAVSLAEFVCGSEEAFVAKMNARAVEIGAKSTNFNNCTGLFDDEKHVTSAYDIAVMTRELLKHEKIFDYTTIWMDTLRGGTFGLANTNKMMRSYSGMNGMKTGYTKLSGYCFSGTAERDGMTLIATVMGAPTSKDRFDAAAAMLDFGFATYSVAEASPEAQAPIAVEKGKKDSLNIEVVGGLSLLVKKGKQKGITTETALTDKVTAPIEKGTEVGVLTYMLNGNAVASCPIVASETIERAGFGDYFAWLFGSLLM